MLAQGINNLNDLRFDWRQFPAAVSIAGIPGRFNGSVSSASRKHNNVSWRAVAQFDAADDIMLFGSVPRGYKGAASDETLVSQTPVFVQPEIPTNHELGFRLMLFDRTTTINITAFKSDFNNVDGGVVQASRGFDFDAGRQTPCGRDVSCDGMKSEHARGQGCR